MTELHPFNRVSFITLNQTRLFTAEQVADLIEQHATSAEQVLSDIEIADLRMEILVGLEVCLLRSDYINAKKIVDKAFSDIKELRAERERG